MRDARADRAGLRVRLGKATTDAERSRLRAQLDRASPPRHAAPARASTSSARPCRYATVELRSTATAAAAPPRRPSGRWTPGDAVGDAVRVLEVIAGVLVIALAVLFPSRLIALPRRPRRPHRGAALEPRARRWTSP